MKLEHAMDVIDDVPGFSEETSSAGEAWVEVKRAMTLASDKIAMLTIVVNNCENEACRGLDEGCWRESLVEIKHTLRVALKSLES